MNKTDMKKLSKSELIKFLLKQETNKPIQLPKLRKIVNLEDLMDDDPFPEYEPVFF